MSLIINIWIMVLAYARWLSPEEISADCEISIQVEKM
jgi:hypothetical protein